MQVFMNFSLKKHPTTTTTTIALSIKVFRFNQIYNWYIDSILLVILNKNNKTIVQAVRIRQLWLWHENLCEICSKPEVIDATLELYDKVQRQQRRCWWNQWEPKTEWSGSVRVSCLQTSAGITRGKPFASTLYRTINIIWTSSNLFLYI